jgi:hypothetical protein
MTALATTLATAGLVAAETTPQAPSAPPAHHATAPMGGGMMGGGMMGGGMMGMGMCPMGMGGADANVSVKNIDKGVTITITSSDPAAAKRLQKMAEAMRLMREAMAQ